MPSIYALLLRLYPAAYREEFGREMADVFQQALGDARSRGAFAATKFFTREIAGLLREGLAQRLASVCMVHELLVHLGRGFTMERQFRYSRVSISFMAVSLVIVLMAMGRAADIVHLYSPLQKGYGLVRPLITCLLLANAAGLLAWLVRFAVRRSGSHRLEQVETWHKRA